MIETDAALTRADRRAITRSRSCGDLDDKGKDTGTGKGRVKDNDKGKGMDSGKGSDKNDGVDLGKASGMNSGKGSGKGSVRASGPMNAAALREFQDRRLRALRKSMSF